MVWLTAEGGGDDEKDDMMRRLVWNVMPGHLRKPKSTLSLSLPNHLITFVVDSSSVDH